VDTNLSKKHSASILNVQVFRVRMLSPSISQKLPIQIVKEVNLITSKAMIVSSSCYLKAWVTVYNRAFNCSSE
jgi:hypothetical protein